VFERFTDRARRVVVSAQEEARLLHHSYIGTEHLLLGLISEGEGIGAQALIQHGVSLEAARARIREIIGEGSEPTSGHVPFTPRAKKVLELSLREAIGLGHNYIGTEHILLGLVREGEGVAAQVLTDLGLTLTELRPTILGLLSIDPEAATEASRVRRRRAIPPSAIRFPDCRHQPQDLSYLATEIPGGEGQSPRSVILVRCTTCGTTIGALPA
jgi:ATP-dependent Clp protease ATP-binding subunit ClpA